MKSSSLVPWFFRSIGVALAGATVLCGCGRSLAQKGSAGAEAAPGNSSQKAGSAALELTQYVDLRIGSKGTQMIPGAAWPFGMMQFSPDTTPGVGSDFNEGYRHEHSHIRAFSMTHFSGAGARAPMDIPIMPTVGALEQSPVGKVAAYASRFSHSREKAIPGDYAVHLESSGIEVELSATKRTGFGRFVYPASPEAHLILNTSGKTYRRPGTDARIEIDPANRCVAGWTRVEPINDKANKYTIYFVIQFDRDFSGYGTWKGAEKQANSPTVGGSDCAAYVSFNATTNTLVNAKVGISFVSIANAKENLRQENPGWDLAAVKKANAVRWNEVLNTCQVTRGGTAAERRLFFTALYRSVLHPNLFSDCNGQYIGFDGKVHVIAKGHNLYANFSLWDVYRTQAPLLGLLFPEESSDMVRSLLLAAEQSAHGGLPIWSHNNDDSDIMNGYSADPFIASIYAFGGTNYDLQGLKERMVYTAVNSVKCNSNGGWRGLSAYKELGYCLHGVEDAWTDVTSTLEYCVDDFAIAQICRAARDEDNYRYFLNRAQNWKNLFNPDNGDGGYVQSRNADGTWVMPFNKAGTEGFSEGNSAQYTWMINHNIGGLAQKMGGNEAMAARLDEFFSKILTDGWNIDKPYFWAGNEPDVQVPFLYNWVGKPWKTQKVVRDCMEAAFQATPEGLHGDDDLGAMYSWYVWCALGLYPEIPGIGGVTVCSPLFESVTVNLPNGKRIVINAKGSSSENRCIQSCALNGAASSALWFSFDTLSRGATLDYVMGSSPNPRWGAAPGDKPPSFDGTATTLQKGFNLYGQPVTNVALNQPARASGSEAKEGPEKAFDGLTVHNSKWCCAAPGEKWLAVDLGRESTISRWVVKHAATGGETRLSNTRDFKLQKSRDGQAWEDVDVVSGNSEDVTDRTVPAFQARYVRLCVTRAVQTGEDIARIYEWELHDSPARNTVAPKPRATDY